MRDGRSPCRQGAISIDDADIECALVRAQEISRYVESGLFDVALTGKDWILENSSDVQEVEDLIYSKATYHPAKWVLAVDENPRSAASKTFGEKDRYRAG